MERMVRERAGHWAEREKIINDGKHNAGVTEKVIDSIIELKPTETLSDLKKRYEETLELLKQVRKNEAAETLPGHYIELYFR